MLVQGALLVRADVLQILCMLGKKETSLIFKLLSFRIKSGASAQRVAIFFLTLRWWEYPGSCQAYVQEELTLVLRYILLVRFAVADQLFL